MVNGFDLRESNGYSWADSGWFPTKANDCNGFMEANDCNGLRASCRQTLANKGFLMSNDCKGFVKMHVPK